MRFSTSESKRSAGRSKRKVHRGARPSPRAQLDRCGGDGAPRRPRREVAAQRGAWFARRAWFLPPALARSGTSRCVQRRNSFARRSRSDLSSARNLLGGYRAARRPYRQAKQAVGDSPTGGARPQLRRSDLFVAEASHPAKSPVGAASSASMPLLRSFDVLPLAIYKYAAPMGLAIATLALDSMEATQWLLLATKRISGHALRVHKYLDALQI